MIKYFLPIIFLSLLLFLFTGQEAQASNSCPNVPISGNYTVTSTCYFDYTHSMVHGVEQGNLTVDEGATLTIHNGQAIVFNPRQRVSVNGKLAINQGGRLSVSNLWMVDADDDNYPATTTQYASREQPGGTESDYRRRHTMATTTVADCNDDNAYIYRLVSGLVEDKDHDGYHAGSAATQCVGTTTGGNFDTGWYSPGTMANDATVGTLAWSNPDNAKTSNDVYATRAFAGNGDSHYLKATNFGFSIPAGSTIDGIVVEIERKADESGTSNNIKDKAVKIVKADGSIGATNKADTVNYWPLTDTYKSYGGSTDLWGETWAYTDINDIDFGVVLQIAGAIRCLSEDSLILTDNDYKKISDIKVGDKVISYNEHSKELEPKTVEAVWQSSISNANNRYFFIYYNNGKIIKATEDHLFYIEKDYVEAKNLKVGDRLLGEDLQKYPIEKIEIIKNTEDAVWDLIVEDNHNFFVNGVLVHNHPLLASVDHIRIKVYYTAPRYRAANGNYAWIYADASLGSDIDDNNACKRLVHHECGDPNNDTGECSLKTASCLAVCQRCDGVSIDVEYASTAGHVCSTGNWTATKTADAYCDKGIDCPGSTVCSATMYYRGCAIGGTSCVNDAWTSYSTWNASTDQAITQSGWVQDGSSCAQSSDGHCAVCTRCNGVGACNACMDTPGAGWGCASRCCGCGDDGCQGPMNPCPFQP